MKQTAVEWLVQTLNKNIDYIPLDKWDEIRNVVQQALAMEKEQIKDAWMDGMEGILHEIAAEQYYNKTYGIPSVKG